MKRFVLPLLLLYVAGCEYASGDPSPVPKKEHILVVVYDGWREHRLWMAPTDTVDVWRDKDGKTKVRWR